MTRTHLDTDEYRQAETAVHRMRAAVSGEPEPGDEKRE